MKNLCSWFISHTIKRLPADIKKIVAYSDTTYNHIGTVYKAANFKLDHEIRPDYWYINQDGWVLHKKTVYNRAVKNNLSESDYATSNNLRKRYGQQKLCYLYER